MEHDCIYLAVIYISYISILSLFLKFLIYKSPLFFS